MKEDYSIEDLTFQKEGMAVYRAKGKDGLKYALTVLTYPEEIICRLNQSKFDKGLRDLVSLKHRSLTKVNEGGVDERDQQVWVTHRWNEGRALQDVIAHRAVEPTELLKLKQDADSLIAALGDRADAIAFESRSIFLGRTSGGELLTKFVINYWQWFHDWALGTPFGGGRDAGREMVKLLSSLDGSDSAPAPSVRSSASAPPAKGPLIVLPGNLNSANSPSADAPASPVEPAPAPVPQPAKTRKLVTGASLYTPAPAPTPQTTPSPASPPPKTRRLVTAAPASAPSPSSSSVQSTLSTMVVTTAVPAHHPAPDLAPTPAPATTRSLVTSAPVQSAYSAPRTKTGATLDSSKSGGGPATLAIVALIVALAVGLGVMVIKKKNPSPTANLSRTEEHDERLGPKPKDATYGKESPLEDPRTEKATPVEIPTPVERARPKPKPRPFVPITPEKVEPRPADAPMNPDPEPRPVVKQLPEVSPEIRPDDRQITTLALDDTAGLASKVNTWIRIKGEVASTSVDGQWAFVGENPVIAQLRDGQLAVVTNKPVEILGWLADEHTLVVAEEYDISYPEPGAETPVTPAPEEAIEDPKGE